MNYEFLDGFNLFLQTTHRCRHNGAVAVMDCLRNFTLYCLRNEWITHREPCAMPRKRTSGQ